MLKETVVNLYDMTRYLIDLGLQENENGNNITYSLDAFTGWINVRYIPNAAQLQATYNCNVINHSRKSQKICRDIIKLLQGVSITISPQQDFEVFEKTVLRLIETTAERS